MAIKTFYEHMAGFLEEVNAKDVVEVGSDSRLTLARALAPHCETFYSVNFAKDHEGMEGWHELLQKQGVGNIILLSGNAVQLSYLIGHADVIVLQNVLIDPTGEDTALAWQYKKGELKCTEEQWETLLERLDQAREDAYTDFLRVANPGHIVTFGRPDDGELGQMLEGLGVERVKKIPLLYDDTRDAWEAYFVDNT
ncbi:hypothetical protein KY329_03930 [Candidatus Woesearchaeota archaeon]|nr:hypothetical protein [Candidatus Woesearchaeota archaeon]